MTKILSDIALDQVATGAQTSTITEPSLGVSGKRILMTGNWFSSRSTDGGSSWKFIDPYTELPPAGASVCCDQLIHYSKSRRLWIWLLQFSKSSMGNIVRVAVSSTGAPKSWTWWDTTPVDVDPTWTKTWFDYPDLTETDDNILLSFNMYGVIDDRWKRAVVLRLSLTDLKAKKALSRQIWSTDQVGSLRFAKGLGSGAIFASHSNSIAGLTLFDWPDAESDVTETEVTVADWNDSSYESNGPNNTPWLNRVDDRIMGGWRAKGVLGFAWCAGADANHPHPFIRVVRIDENNHTLIDEPDLWSAKYAWAYPATIANRRGDVGITAFCGSETIHPTHAVGCLNEQEGLWEMTTGTASTHGPEKGKWGDYLDIQADPSRRTYWIASGFVLNGGSERTHIEPRIILFKP